MSRPGQEELSLSLSNIRLIEVVRRNFNRKGGRMNQLPQADRPRQLSRRKKDLATEGGVVDP